jgi:hypothetical protein
MRTMLSFLVAATLAGCYSPTYHDGQLHCADPNGAGPPCPDGWHCAVDQRCWSQGHDPPRPPVHATFAGGGDPHLADGNYTLGLSVGQPLGGTVRGAGSSDHVLQVGVLRDAVSP